MSYDELLELKKEVDELSLYYSALKEKSKELDEIFYSNNLLDSDYDSYDYDDDTIEEKIQKERNGYTINKIFGYFFRYMLIYFGGALFDIPKYVHIGLILVNLGYYCFVILGYEKIMRKKLEAKDDDKMDLETVANEKRKVDKRLEYVREKFISASSRYEQSVSKLEERDYEEYLEYISEYLQFMLENSKELLKEAKENCELPDYEIDAMLDENEDTHTYRLN